MSLHIGNNKKYLNNKIKINKKVQNNLKIKKLSECTNKKMS